MSEADPGFLDTKYLVDPYGNWAKAEGVPIHVGATVDLMAAETAPWARFGLRGAICHLDGRCDFLTAFLFELQPGSASAPMRHLYEEALYVLDGRGVAEIALSDGRVQSVDWSAGTLFAVPVNASLVLRATGSRPARLVALNDLRYLMGLYRNENFLFANPVALDARQSAALAAGLVLTPASEPAVTGLSPLPLADLSVGIDLLTILPGQSTEAQRQMQGRHLVAMEGEGFTLSFSNATSDLVRTDWRPGLMIGLPGMMFHQHVNKGATPARALSMELGSQASPMFRSRRAAYGDMEVYASGSAKWPTDSLRPDVAALCAG